MRALFAFLVLCLASGGARAGAWTKPEGGGYLKLGSSSFVSGHAFDTRGDRVETEGFELRAQTLYFYGEYGLADGLTVVGFLPYVISTNQHASGIAFHTLGLGDAMLGVQAGLFAYGPVVVSSRLEVKVPLYQGEPSIQGRRTAQVPGYPRTARYFPALGDGQVDLTSYLSLGASFPWFDGFFSVEAGYRLRTGSLTDAVVANGTGGVFALRRRLVFLLNLATVLTFPSADERRVTVGKGYWAVGPGAMVFLADGLALEVGADLVTRGVNAAGGYQLQFGVSHAF